MRSLLRRFSKKEMQYYEQTKMKVSICMNSGDDDDDDECVAAGYLPPSALTSMHMLPDKTISVFKSSDNNDT